MRDLELFKSGEQILKKSDLTAALSQLGLKGGEIICVHAELFKIGQIMPKKAEFLSAILASFYEILGPNGTLLMPTFTYSFCENKAYDKLNSKSTMGALSEFFRAQSGIKRSDDPIFSFAVGGAKSELFLKPCESCFGDGSAYDALAKNGGKILLLGTRDLGYTFSHYTEQKFGVDYRYFKDFSGEIIYENGERKNATIKYYVRDLTKKNELSIPKQRDLLIKTGNFKSAEFGLSSINLIDAKKYLQANLSAFAQDQNALLV